MVNFMSCFSESENYIFSNNAYQTKCLSRTKNCEIFNVVFLFSSETWCSTESERASYLFGNLVATDYSGLFCSAVRFFCQSLPRNVLKDSTESNSPHVEVHSCNNLLLSGSCHLTIQTNSQELLRNTSNFLWSSVLFSDLMNSGGTNQSLVRSFKTLCSLFAIFYLSRTLKSYILLVC